jgi:DNA-directed RNA polymerase subunit RPC12/RpoP
MTKCAHCGEEIKKPTQYRRGKHDLCKVCFFKLIYKFKAKSLAGRGK